MIQSQRRRATSLGDWVLHLLPRLRDRGEALLRVLTLADQKAPTRPPPTRRPSSKNRGRGTRWVTLVIVMQAAKRGAFSRVLQWRGGGADGLSDGDVDEKV